MNCKLPFSQGF